MGQRRCCEKGTLAFISVWGRSHKPPLLKEAEWKEMTRFLPCAKGVAGSRQKALSLVRNTSRGTLRNLGFRASQLCGLSCLLTLEVHWYGKVFWVCVTSNGTASKLSRDSPRPSPGMAMDNFLPLVSGYLEHARGPLRTGSPTSFTIYSVLWFIQMLEEPRVLEAGRACSSPWYAFY